MIRDSQNWWTPPKYKEEFRSLGFHAQEAFMRRHCTGWRTCGVFHILHIDGRSVAQVREFSERKAAEEKAIAEHFQELVELGAIDTPLPVPAAAQATGVKR